MKKKMVYLARFGKVHGPFTDQELEAFQANGKINEFTWVWDYSGQGWKPLDPPPAALFDTGEQSEQVGSAQILQYSGHAQPTTAGPSPMDLGFPSTRGQVSVVCHNFRQVVSGFVHRMTATGCELKTSDGHLSPAFVSRSSVVLNLLDGESGKLMNVSCRICGVTRTPDGWVYQVRWEQRPEIQVA